MGRAVLQGRGPAADLAHIRGGLAVTLARDREGHPERLAEDLRRWRELAGVPGAALVLVDARGPIDVLTDGLADVGRGIPVQPGHRFEIGSISKSLTAIALLRMADRRLVRLDDPVRRCLPWFRAGRSGGRITLHHLLTHTSGIPNGGDAGDASAFDVWALRDADVLPPGSRYWYSNAGYKALGGVVAAVADRPFPDLLRDEALEPFGMLDALPAVPMAGRDHFAVGYEPEPGAYPRSQARRVPAPAVAITMGDGSIAATPMDMGRYAAGLLRNLARPGRAGPGLLEPSSAAALVARHVRSGPGAWYGYGLVIRRSDGRWWVGHGGDTLGFGASLVCDARAGVAVAVLANLRAAPTGHLARHVIRVLAADREGTPRPAFEAPRSSVEHGARWFVGRAGRVRADLGADEPYLERDGVTRALLDRGLDRFEVDDPITGRYLLHVESSDGVPTRLVHGPDVFEVSGDAARVVRHHDRRDRPAGLAYAGVYRSHNPWRRGIEVLVRDGHLVLVEDDGEEAELVRLGAGRFRIGREANPERVAFDAVVGGRALRATAGGAPFVRVE